LAALAAVVIVGALSVASTLPALAAGGHSVTTAPTATESLPDGHVQPLTAANCRSSPSSTNCDHVDPAAANCAYDAYTVAAANIYNYAGSLQGRVDLRYDSACQSNWARTVYYNGSWDLTASVCVEGFQSGYCEPSDYDTYSANNSTIWSNMMWAPVECAQAAGVIYNFGNQTGCY
jgi:hypothetical protein